jgi:hypothetical protein
MSNTLILMIYVVGQSIMLCRRLSRFRRTRQPLTYSCRNIESCDPPASYIAVPCCDVHESQTDLQWVSLFPHCVVGLFLKSVFRKVSLTVMDRRWGWSDVNWCKCWILAGFRHGYVFCFLAVAGKWKPKTTIKYMCCHMYCMWDVCDYGRDTDWRMDLMTTTRNHR